MWLALDIGNSALKAGLFDGDALIRTKRIPIQSGTLASGWQDALSDFIGQTTIERTGISTVVPDGSRQVGDFLHELTGDPPLFITTGMEMPFDSHYATPETLGVDRLMAAAGAWSAELEAHPHSDGALVIDAGTALTVEVLSRAKGYLGGTIGPGPALMAQALENGTAQLPHPPLQKPSNPIGDSTESAIQSGVMYGFIDVVEGALRRHQADFDSPLVVATGGWATFLADEISAIDRVDPHLVLHGVQAVMKLNR